MYKPSVQFKALMAISLLLLILIVAINIAFAKGEELGFVDGRLHGTVDCMIYMNKLAETLTNE